MVAHEDDPHLNVNDKEAFFQTYLNASIGKEICTFKPTTIWRLIIAHAEGLTRL